MSSEQNIALVRQLIEEVMNKGNVGLVDKIMSPDFIEHEEMPGVPPSREGFKQMIPMMTAGLTGFKANIDDVFAAGDKVVVRMTWSGTQTGPFLGMPPSGKSFSIGVIDILRIDGGQIVEHWGQMDMMGMLQQLGAIPSQG